MAAPTRTNSASTFARDKWVWVPTIATPTGPKISEVTGGSTLDVSCYLFDETDKPTVESNRVTRKRRLCDKTQEEGFGVVKYNGGTLRYAVAPQAAAGSSGKKAFETLTAGTTGYLLRRMDLPVETDLALGHFVNLYQVTLDVAHIEPIGDGEDAEASVSQDYVIVGTPVQNVAIVS